MPIWTSISLRISLTSYGPRAWRHSTCYGTATRGGRCAHIAGQGWQQANSKSRAMYHASAQASCPMRVAVLRTLTCTAPPLASDGDMAKAVEMRTAARAILWYHVSVAQQLHRGSMWDSFGRAQALRRPRSSLLLLIRSTDACVARRRQCQTLATASTRSVSSASSIKP